MDCPACSGELKEIKRKDIYALCGKRVLIKIQYTCLSCTRRVTKMEKDKENEEILDEITRKARMGGCGNCGKKVDIAQYVG